MNRKERRATGKSAAPGGSKASGSGGWVDQLMAAADGHLAAGQLAPAEGLYQKVLAIDSHPR
jgi:hypothetical protein